MSDSGFTTFPLFSEDLGPPSKRCIHCREVKPVTEFFTSRGKRLGVHCVCKVCNRAYQKDRYNKRSVTYQFNPEAQKRCQRCREIKLATEFRKNPSGRHGISNTCKKCYGKHMKERLKSEPGLKEAMRFARRSRKYDISRDEYERKHAEQGGVCGICGGGPRGTIYETDLLVDHCHSTYTLRMLLCGDCNRGLGCFKDDPALLRKAAEYIERFRDEAIG